MALLVGSSHAVAIQPAPPAQSFPSAVRWNVELAAAVLVPPVIAHPRVFVALQSGVVAAHRLEDGREEWTAKVEVDGPMATDGNVIVVPAQERVHALDVATGTIAWTGETGSPSAPLLLRGGWLIVASNRQLAALRASDGTEIWRHPVGLITVRPAIDGPNLFVSVADGRVLALELSSGSLVWERAVGADPTEPLVLADRVYVGVDNRSFVCLSATTGEEQWKQLIGAALRGAPAADASHVYLASMDNLLRALHRTNGAIRWRKDLGHRPSAGPFVLGSAVAVPGMTATLQGFSIRGEPAGQLKFADQMATAPAFSLAEGSPPMLVAVTGNLQNVWTLTAVTDEMEQGTW